MLISEGVILRTPFEPFKPSNFSQAFKTFSKSKAFHEALFLASPNFYSEISKGGSENSEVELISQFKYYLRMSFRCTPFGMFSGVSSGTVGAKTSFQLLPQNTYTKYTRLDNHFLNTFIQRISSDNVIRKEIKWFANNTIYSNGFSLRYADYRLTSNQRSHHLAKVDITTYIESVLAKAQQGATFNELLGELVSDEVTVEEAEAFLDEVIESKLLLSELEPIVTGEEPYARLLSILARYKTGAPYVSFLKSLIGALGKIDEYGPGADITTYEYVLSCIKEWDEKYDPKLVFQSDLSKQGDSITLGEDVLREVKNAIEFLALLNGNFNHGSLQKFKEEFSKRYEDAEVPLLEILDTESGIGYPVGAYAEGDQSPLIDGFFFLGVSQAIEHKVMPWQKKLMHLYQQCLQEGKIEIVLTDETFSLDKNLFQEARLPDSFSSIVSILGSPDKINEGDFKIDYKG
ncbi:MAG: lantibiotic dehydratase family protein, partial [Flammeovirgaceae bacterium]